MLWFHWSPLIVDWNGADSCQKVSHLIITPWKFIYCFAITQLVMHKVTAFIKGQNLSHLSRLLPSVPSSSFPVYRIISNSQLYAVFCFVLVRFGVFLSKSFSRKAVMPVYLRCYRDSKSPWPNEDVGDANMLLPTLQTAAPSSGVLAFLSKSLSKDLFKN